MVRWLCACVVAAGLTGFAVLLLGARYPKAGPVVIALSHEHGIHLGDVVVVAVWAVSVLALGGLVIRPGRRDASRRTRRRSDSPVT